MATKDEDFCTIRRIMKQLELDSLGYLDNLNIYSKDSYATSFGIIQLFLFCSGL